MRETDIHKTYMREALKEAEKARGLGEVPVGAVVVKDGEIIGRGHNLTETSGNPTAHAEMEAIKNASRNLGGWRLPECSMYVTIEPCPMCAGAIILARLKSVYIGAADPKSGACGSVFDLLASEFLNHRTETVFGILEDDCAVIVTDFFKNIRKHKKLQSEDI